MSDLWETERKLWLAGTGEMSRHLAEGCVLAFPSMGITGRAEALARIADASRWSEVQMLDRRSFSTDDVVVLGYRARARRPGQPVYEALVTSCWHDGRDGWRIVQHHHAPVG